MIGNQAGIYESVSRLCTERAVDLLVGTTQDWLMKGILGTVATRHHESVGETMFSLMNLLHCLVDLFHAFKSHCN